MTRTLGLSLLLLAAACGSNGGMSLSARAGTTSAPPSRSSSLTRTSGIQLSRVRICLRSVRLEPVGGNSGDDSDDAEIRTSPMVVDLSGAALDGARVTTVVNADVKPGTYSKIKFEIHKPSSSESADAAVQAMAAQDASIIAEGTIDGAAFTFTTGLDVEQEFEGNLTIKDGSNLTLNVDPAAWFGPSASARLDPRLSGNRSAIEANIQASFRAFEDDDRNGEQD